MKKWPALASSEALPRPSPEEAKARAFHERILFLVALALESVLTLYLIMNYRIPDGHDSFHYFTLQYYFLNNAVLYGEIPQWIPFLTHGAVATLWYTIQAGFLQNVLFLFAGWLKAVNFVTLFHLGIWFDSLLLLTGTWLLGKRFFTSPFTVFFVSLSAMASGIWSLQPWWNFHLYYALPLILHFLHSFLDTGKWRYLFLAGNLLAIQTLGNLPYFLPLLTLAIFLYFAFYFLVRPEFFLKQTAALKYRWPATAAFLGIVLSFLAIYLVIRWIPEMGHMASFKNRNPDGTVPLEIFLTAGGNFTLNKWLELLVRISFPLDYTLFIGSIAAPMILFAFLFALRKENAHLALLVLTLLLFSLGTVVSVFFYFSWPMMKFFRFLALSSCLIKLLLCFFAGFGFEAVFIRKIFEKRSAAVTVFLLFLILGIGALSFALLYGSRHFDDKITLARVLLDDGLSAFPLQLSEKMMHSRLEAAAYSLLAAAIVISLPLWANFKKYFFPVLLLTLGLHAADLYEYKFIEVCATTTPLSPGDREITAFQPIPYAARRSARLPIGERRAKFLMENFYTGGLYWAHQSFLFTDLVWSPFQTDHWLRPFDHFMKVYSGNLINEYYLEPTRVLERLRSHPAARKMTGLTEDKIQIFSGAFVFSNAYFNEQDQWTGNLMIRPGYNGDIPILSRPEPDSIPPGTILWTSSEPLDLNARNPGLPYQVTQYSSNHLGVDVDLPDSSGNAWLFYSDVWHPSWRATVNGKPVAVYKANLAYKAVPITAGKNTVHFYFYSKLVAFLTFSLGLNSLFWCLWVLTRAGKILSTPSPTAPVLS